MIRPCIGASSSAGMDEVVKLWDLRNTSSPVASYHGHVPGGGKKLKRIHRPVFYNVSAAAASSFILSGGEGSRAVSMFRLGPGGSVDGGSEGRPQSVFSRGKLPVDAGDVGCLAVANGGREVAAAVDGGEVLLLSPGS